MKQAIEDAVVLMETAALRIKRAVRLLEAAGVGEDDRPYDNPIAWDAMRLLQNAKAAQLHTTDYFGS